MEDAKSYRKVIVGLDKGYFVVSLDFEIIYGLLDVVSEDYYKNLYAVSEVIPKILELFKEYSIAATWAPVGMLFNSDINELLQNIPSKIPHYSDQKLSTYTYIRDIQEKQNHLFFAKNLIALIAEYPYQEIATHTYCHYYCTEPGQSIDEFDADIKQAIKITKDNGFEAPYSMIFPRNMCNEKYLCALESNGIKTYRGETKAWYSQMPENLIKRAIRLMDAYLNIGGYECYDLQRDRIINIPASRFLYPYGKIQHLDWLKLNRIKKQMKYAATHKKVFHLWWHPHNFGANIASNINSLRYILDYYSELNNKYNMESANMKMLGEQYCAEE